MADLTKQILDQAGKGSAGFSEADRSALLQASRKLSESLENPVEKLLRLFLSLYDPIVIRLAVDLNLVDIALGHGGPISLNALAKKSGAEADLLQRMLRILVLLDIFAEPSPGIYTTASLAPVFSSASPATSAAIHLTHMYPGIAAIPEYLAKTGYKNPTDAHDAPFNLAFDFKGKTYFDLMAQPGNERFADAFNKTMEMNKSRDEAKFINSYPAAERLKQDDSDRVLFVDIGGNLGHQVRKFAETYPSLAGKLVLEDLPEVVEQAIDVPSSITKIGHDFFTPQPASVKHAKAFYLRMILHDWPEKQARSILSHIVDVMADDSVVLIHEVIMPEAGVGHQDATMDWHMFVIGSLERTEKQWAELGDSVGLKVNGIWWEEAGLGSRGMLELSKKL